MPDWNMIAAGSDILGGIFKTGYNLFTNKRDFDYQKALQQQIFQREDTAVQRRMADLEAAGINPNLAAGSAAGAGSIVARSNTNDINVGSMLDTLNAKSQLKQQNLKNDITNYEKEVAKYTAEEAKFKAADSIHRYLADMGITTLPSFENGEFTLLKPDDAYVNNTPALQEYEAKVVNYQDAYAKIIRENTALQNQLTKTTTDMILGKAQLSNWSFSNTLDMFKALSGRDISSKELEVTAEKLGLDIKKFNFNTFVQSLPMLLMLINTL